MELIKCTTVWFKLYLDWAHKTAGTKTRLYSLDGGIQKPDMASTLLNSVYLRLKTKTLIWTLIDESNDYPSGFSCMMADTGPFYLHLSLIFTAKTISFQSSVYLELHVCVSLCLYPSVKCLSTSHAHASKNTKIHSLAFSNFQILLTVFQSVRSTQICLFTWTLMHSLTYF
jgi:hypothetical protein